MVKNNTKSKLIIICGSTGSGKTSLAVSLCKRFNGEIVNVDSRQVYRGMDIGTAKYLDMVPVGEPPCGLPKKGGHIDPPLRNTIQGIPVHLVNIVNPDERYNVGRFKKEAEEAIGDILKHEKVPFIVGGTGLYIDALVDNFEIPTVGAGSPRPKKQGAETAPLRDLVKSLEKIDPDALKIVDLKNRRRIERALEYCLTSGKKFSASRKKGERKYNVLKIAPLVTREVLIEKINQRVDEMIEDGLEKEVKILSEKYGWESEAMTGIGYREWREYFVGAGSPRPKKQGAETAPLREIIVRIKIDTRQYAKRQMTWFKRDNEINYVDLKKAEKLIKKFLVKNI